MPSVLAARTLSGLLGAIVVVGSFLVTNDGRSGMPLILIGQGVTVQQISGRDVFVLRSGSVLTVWDMTTPGTDSNLVFCPGENFFVAPEDGALFDDQGRYVEGPGTGDMNRHVTKIDPRAVLQLGRRITSARSEGEISGEAGQAYLEWRSDPDTPRSFCQDEIPAI